MQAQAFFDVDLRVFRSYLEGYAVGFQAWYGDEVTVELAPPPEELKNLTLDPRRYGILMFNWLFKDRLADAFLKARKTAGVFTEATFPSTESGIRLRLCLDGVAPQLARLPWEVLQGPDDYLPLSLSTAFSRFTRVRARSTTPSIERPLRMLQIFANPADLHAYALPQLDPALAQLTDHLGGAVSSLIVIDRLEEPVTLEAILDRLQRGYHMVYAVAQTLIDDRLYVLLADDSDNARRVSGDDISAALGIEPCRIAAVGNPGNALDPPRGCRLDASRFGATPSRNWHTKRTRLRNPAGVPEAATVQRELLQWALANRGHRCSCRPGARRDLRPLRLGLELSRAGDA